ncbi:MAG: LPS export ABC transporter periplasmic protein LptC [Desulfobacula sp.]|nr:LPS export ABC transporter periplasmic protein LptC [Desulfobacula sp.]
MTQSVQHKLTYSLIGTMILVSLVIGGYFYIDKWLSEPIEIKDVKIDTKAALKLNILKQISKKNGIKEWALEAKSATLLKNEDKAVLIEVSVVFFTKDNKQVHLKSQKGVLDTKKHNMTFSDHVVVTYEASVLRTDQLHYNKKKHIIYSDAQVRLEKQGSIIEADSMTINLNNTTTILTGHVKGQFRDNFKLQ